MALQWPHLKNFYSTKLNVQQHNNFNNPILTLGVACPEPVVLVRPVVGGAVKRVGEDTIELDVNTSEALEEDDLAVVVTTGLPESQLLFSLSVMPREGGGRGGGSRPF